MTDELDPAGVQAATNRVAYEVARDLSRTPPPHHIHSERIATAAITAYLQATPPMSDSRIDACPECGWLPQRQHAVSCSATTGIEGVTNDEVDAFLAERAAPPRADGPTFENADEAIKYLSTEYVAAKDDEITRLRVALEYVSRGTNCGCAQYARNALATTTQDSRDAGN